MNKYKFKPFDKVLVRASSTTNWCPSLYGYRIIRNGETFHVCAPGGRFDQCIPYNEETARLIGTNHPYQPAEPKEYYVSWGPDSEMQQTEYTAEEFMHFIKTAVINNKDISNFMVRRIRS